MKQASLYLSLFAGAMIAITGCQMNHDREDRDDEGESEMKIQASEAPAAARDAFNREHPGAKITSVEKETYADGTAHYEFEFTDASCKKGDAEYDASGKKAHEDDDDK
jgi:hypothetical protein